MVRALAYTPPKEKDRLLLSIGIATIFFNLIWGVLPATNFDFNFVAGVLGMIAGIPIIMHSNKRMFYVSMLLSAFAGIFYLISTYLIYTLDIIGTILCLIILATVYMRRVSFTAPPPLAIPPPTYQPPTPSPPVPVTMPSIPEKKAIFCPYCGNKIMPEAKFCPYCGCKLEEQLFLIYFI